MSPTFNPAPQSNRSDLVLLNRTVTYKHAELAVGDIVTLISPLDPRLLLTKRVIALPGDSVRVWVPGGRWRRIQVPPGHVWVEGDAAVDILPGSLERVANGESAPAGWRNKSRDSREFGPVPMGLITSRIEAVVWPPERWGRPAPRPEPRGEANGKYPQSSNDRMTQVNPSLARVLDEMTLMDKQGRGRKAHPQDSVISPYVDWDDPHAQDEGTDPKEEGEDGRRRKHAWNQSSRGGRLGDDAD
uniref:Peptidase S26 domain-containing protein n=2 Tax=Kalmanozyma brasiliensis (strain GHG001) TaxID=1365824 RepID=V5GP93_KALBG